MIAFRRCKMLAHQTIFAACFVQLLEAIVISLSGCELVFLIAATCGVLLEKI